MGNFSSDQFPSLATRYHRQIPNQPFVVLTSHRNERYYLSVRDDDDDCFKVISSRANWLSVSRCDLISFRSMGERGAAYWKYRWME